MGNGDMNYGSGPMPGQVWAGVHGWVSLSEYNELAKNPVNALPQYRGSGAFQHGAERPTFDEECRYLQTFDPNQIPLPVEAVKPRSFGEILSNSMATAAPEPAPLHWGGTGVAPSAPAAPVAPPAAPLRPDFPSFGAAWERAFNPGLPPPDPDYIGPPYVYGQHLEFVGKVEEATRLLLSAVEPRPERGGLVETPKRVSKAWAEWTSGYFVNPADILKVFEDGAEECDEMVIVKDIPLYSKCEHHLADIFGTATVAYIPGEEKRIIGLSKFSRLVDMYARRLQVQERLTNQIATALMDHLAPLGCGVVVKARHMCMESRGVKQAGTVTITSALRGAFKLDPTVRAEFLKLAM